MAARPFSFPALVVCLTTVAEPAERPCAVTSVEETSVAREALGAAMGIPVSAEAPTPELVKDDMTAAVPVAVDDGSAEVTAEAEVDGAARAGEENPPSYAEVVGEADEDDLDASAVDDVPAATEVAPAGPEEAPSALDDAEIEPVSLEVVAPAATGVADHASEPAVDPVPVPEPLPATEQAAEEKVTFVFVSNVGGGGSRRCDQAR